jgi:hypothetical protein
MVVTNTLAYNHKVTITAVKCIIVQAPDLNFLLRLIVSIQVEKNLDAFLTQDSNQGILKGKYHCTIDLLIDWFGLVSLQIKTKLVSCHTADSKPVKQVVNGTVILPLVFPVQILYLEITQYRSLASVIL